MKTENGKYLLTMERFNATSTRRWGWEYVAKQSYGSLTSAVRDADEYVRAGGIDKRRAYVTHVAGNGAQTKVWLYVVETPEPSTLPARVSMADIEREAEDGSMGVLGDDEDRNARAAEIATEAGQQDWSEGKGGSR